MGELIDMPMLTRLDIPADKVLSEACKAGFSKVLIMGYDEDDCFMWSSSTGDAGDILWLIELLKKELIP